MAQQRDPSREQFWRETVAAWQRSGQTIRAFCVAQRLSEASLYAWRRELTRRDGALRLARKPAPARPRGSAAAAKFVPLQVLPQAFLEVVLPTGVSVRLPSGADATTVTTVAGLVAALRAASC